MPEPTTILKALATFPVLPGIFLTLMGAGLAPVDENMAEVASIFIGPLGIPTKAFFLLLGPCKILGGLSMWGIGPMPEAVGRTGLAFAAACALVGHYVVGDNIVQPTVYLGIMGSLFIMEKSKGKKE